MAPRCSRLFLRLIDAKQRLEAVHAEHNKLEFSPLWTLASFIGELELIIGRVLGLEHARPTACSAFGIVTRE